MSSGRTNRLRSNSPHPGPLPSERGTSSATVAAAVAGIAHPCGPATSRKQKSGPASDARTRSSDRSRCDCDGDGRLVDEPDPGAHVRDLPALFIIQRKDGVSSPGPRFAVPDRTARRQPQHRRPESGRHRTESSGLVANPKGFEFRPPWRGFSVTANDVSVGARPPRPNSARLPHLPVKTMQTRMPIPDS